MQKILVLGIGNLVQSDDGFGVHVIRTLLKEKNSLPPNVDLLDGGTSIVDQMGELADADRLICIDVAEGGRAPGTIYRFKPEEVAYKNSKFHHAHKISLFDTLEMVRLMKKQTPETIIIAVQPEKIEWGTDLSLTLKNATPHVLKMIRNEIAAANVN